MEEFNDNIRVKISVIVPIYNGASTIEKAIQCLMNQTLSDIEILLINDGSTDATDEICRKYVNTCHNLTYMSTENRGVSAARNIGLEKASGEYIGFLDADDIVPDNYFEYLYELALENNADIAMVSKLLVDTAGKPNKNKNKKKNIVLMDGITATDKLLHGKLETSVYTKIFKQTICKNVRFIEGRKINEDKFFIFQALVNASQVVYQPIQMYFQWENPNSVTRSGFSEKQFDYLYFAEEIEKYIKINIPELDKAADINTLETYFTVLVLGKKDGSTEKYKKQFDIIRKEIKRYPINFVIRNFSLKRIILYFSVRYSLPFYDWLYKIYTMNR